MGTNTLIAASCLRRLTVAKELQPICAWQRMPQRCRLFQGRWCGFGSSLGRQTKSRRGDGIHGAAHGADLRKLLMPGLAAVEAVSRIARTNPWRSLRSTAALVDSNHAGSQLPTN
jgi:hypothetical protein